MSDQTSVEETRVYHAYSAYLLLKAREDALEAAADVYSQSLTMADHVRQKAWDAALATYKDAIADAHRAYADSRAKLDRIAQQMTEYAAREDSR